MHKSKNYEKATVFVFDKKRKKKAETMKKLYLRKFISLP